MPENNYHKRNIGPQVFWLIPLLVIPLWLTAYPETTVKHSAKGFFIYSSQLFALAGFALFAVTFILAARIKWLESWFGGLDKMYHTHHRMANVAFVLLLFHPILLATRWIPQDIAKVFWYFFPVHRRLAVDFGSWSLWGLIILMLLTLVIKLPYDKWKLTHKFMGVIFIFGVIHLFALDNLATANPLLLLYLLILSGAAIAAWLYKSFLLEHVLQKPQVQVTNVDRLSDQVMEIELEAGEAITFTPGQFYFFSFIAPDITREAHPYTVCSAPGQRQIKIMVKALGDYTRNLYRNLEAGASAFLEGPYGRFDNRQESKSQVWIAGGVGIAPFLSWIRNMKEQDSDLKTDLYYCVNSEEEAVYLNEFKEFEKQSTGFNIHLVCADREGFLDARDISDLKQKTVYICGPRQMRQKLLSELKKMNVSEKDIHYEDFDFF
ncbi:ferric reductase-like transmembrane domain-containing protein [Halalkalibaculum sp. DA3122]|uniref:ferredoxin reductase family protein n=1 Tax=Halalkalibaculum sp. DA3122 TaxID=3373607 RepID=UPI003754AC30